MNKIKEKFIKLLREDNVKVDFKKVTTPGIVRRSVLLYKKGWFNKKFIIELVSLDITYKDVNTTFFVLPVDDEFRRIYVSYEEVADIIKTFSELHEDMAKRKHEEDDKKAIKRLLHE